MSALTDIYEKSVAENKRNFQFWEDYLKNLRSIDFNVFSEMLTVPILVPIGSRIMFRGHLKHTNEVTAALGADYFTKCSTKQAEVLRQHRIKDAEKKVDMYSKERDYLEKQISFSTDNILQTQGEEIIETFTEEDDKVWRAKHRENIRKYKKDVQMIQKTEETKSDDDLWTRLEELELQEELDRELQKPDNIHYATGSTNTEYFNLNEEESINKEGILEIKNDNVLIERKLNNLYDANELSKQENKEIMSSEIFTNKNLVQTPKLDLLHQVIDRQKQLEKKLLELKTREPGLCKNENDLISKLDEMDQLDELEDELERLDDILETEDTDDEQENSTSQSSVVGKHVSFVDNDDSKTLQILFVHSNNQADVSLYDVNKGLQKPSDIYEVYSNLFEGSTSILKKSKYVNDNINQTSVSLNKNDKLDLDLQYGNVTTRTIVVKDVKERTHENTIQHMSEGRPKSVFKKMRMQNKS